MSRRTGARAGWLLVAHRGASASAPENTVAAFELPKEQGAEAVECDVRLTGDDVPVVFHDETLDRLANTPVSLANLAVRELGRFAVGGQPIPTLAEALSWSANGLPLIVEIKSAPNAERVATAVADALARVPAARVLTLSSFDETILTALTGTLPGVSRSLISAGTIEDALARADSLGLNTLHLHWSAVIAGGWPRERSLMAWTVDDPTIANSLIARGVNGIMTNDPQVLAPLRWDDR